MPSKTSNMTRNKHPSPAGPTDSRGSLRRVIRASGCRLCRDCKFVYPQQNTLGKLRQQSSDPGPEQPKVELKLGGKYQDPSASNKIIIWLDKYPQVVLYDIAQKCACIRDRRTDQDPRPGHPHTWSGLCTDKRIKLGDTSEGDILPSSPDLESSRNQTTSASRIIEKPHFLESRPPALESQYCLAPSIGSNSTFGLGSIHKKPCGEITSPIKSNTAEVSEELLSESGEMDLNDPESFSCQRVKPCPRMLRVSCARTYMPWPLSKSSSTLKAHAETAAQPAEHVDLLAKDHFSCTGTQKQPSSSSKRTNDVIPDLPTDSQTTDTKHQIDHLDKTKREDGKCVLVERIHDDDFSPHTAKSDKSQASLSSAPAALSTLGRCGPTLSSSPVVSDSQTDSSTSTPSPTALGLNGWEAGLETIHMKPCDEITSLMKSDTAEVTEELLSESGEMDLNDPESFICQRVKPCPRMLCVSCAGTYVPQPLSKSSSTLKAHAETAAQPAEHVDLLAKDHFSCTGTQEQPSLSSKRTSDVNPDMPTDSISADTKHQINHLNKKKREDGRWKERIHDDEFAPHTAKSDKSQASLSSAPAALSTLGRCGPMLSLSSVVSDAQTDSSMSTPAPTALGLNDWEAGLATIHKKPCGEITSHIKSNTAEVSEELLSESGEMDLNDPESFTCQRVKPCPRMLRVSCARTYMPWPLSKSSSTLKAHAETAAQSEEHVDLLAKDNFSCTGTQKQPSLSSKRTNDLIPDLPTDSQTTDMKHISHHLNIKKREDGRCVLVEKIHDDEFSPHTAKSDKSQASLSSAPAALSTLGRCGPTLSSSSVVNDSQTDSSTSTPSPTALGLNDWEAVATLLPASSPFSFSGLSRLSSMQSSVSASLFLVDEVKSVESTEAQSAAPHLPTCLVKSLEKSQPYCEEYQATSDSLASDESAFLLPQEAPGSDEELPTDRCPPKLEPFYKTSPCNHHLASLKGSSLPNISSEAWVENHLDRFPFPPVLSPITSPIWHSLKGSPTQSAGSSDEEEETKNYLEMSKGPTEHNMSVGCDNPQTVQTDDLDGDRKETEGASENSETLSSVRSGPQSSSCSGGNVGNDGEEEERQHESDYETNKTSEQNPSDPESQPTLGSDSPARSCSASSSDEDEGGAFSDEEQPCSSGEDSSNLFAKADCEKDGVRAEGTHRGVLDEFTAYEQDILLVDVTQDDPELFEISPQSALKLGPNRVTETPKNRHITRVKTLFPRTDEASVHLDKRITPVTIDLRCDSPDNTEESSRSWRPQCNTNPASKQSSAWTAKQKQTRALVHFDANNNGGMKSFERINPIKTTASQQNPIPAWITTKNVCTGQWNSNQTNMAELRRQQTNAYCRQYFSESLSCGYKMCWFLHIPIDGDEKFCIETVVRFTKNPKCLQRAGAVFTGYYENNPPGGYFSMPVLMSLLWALLKAGMVSEVLAVLSICLTHKIVPGHEFLLALFSCVREKGLLSLVPELIQLTFKMASAGLLLSLDFLDSVKNTPEFQQTNSLMSGTGPNKISTSAPLPDYLNLAHSIVEIELCTKQEDWRRMGEVFRSICQSSQRPNQVERFSGRITIALLSESKDKLCLPFTAFAETACKSEEEESLNRCFFGRIGISLMLRYYKTHQWAKGRRVVEVLSCSKVNYVTLKGLFGNENGTSRCSLVTVAAELFVQCGSVEGALNTFRENNWFVSSAAWPCESADLESRIRVLQRLAEKSSHRDSLEVLSNLPGLKEANNLLDPSMYTPLFNTLLQTCLERHTLPVASDTVDLMFSKNLAVDQAMLHMLLNKLGKQKLWLRARDLFRHSLRVGYYQGVSAQPGCMFLEVPCQLGEVELALTLEMFITVNANILHLPENSTSHLNIALKRAQSCESEYLNASNRLASAACIPNPKLAVHYTAVNSAQEQVYTLDISSARAWLRQNHFWANEVWTH